jgi:hypothetical protein
VHIASATQHIASATAPTRDSIKTAGWEAQIQQASLFNPMRLRGDLIGTPPTVIQKFALILLTKHYP